MTMTATYTCDGVDCDASHKALGGQRMPRGWTRARGFLTPKERRPRQGGRPVVHFCPRCTARRNTARTVLGRERLRVA